LTQPPVATPTAPTGKTVRVVICFRAKPTAHPPLYVVDGAVLGLRPDGTVDHDAAGRALGTIDPNQIVSIQMLKDSIAIARFGPGAHAGAAIIETYRSTGAGKDSSRAKSASP
jgi:hypothetical protein